VRVIAGFLGGRRFKAPRGRGTRPTSDRVREALFMALEPLAGARIVDLYAGSGALGIEALSRGAERADFVESDRAALAALEGNLRALALAGQARVWRLTLPRGLSRLGVVLPEADVVFMDPPYGGATAGETLAALAAPAALKVAARVVIEHHTRDILPESVGQLVRVRQRRYGETVVSTYRVAVGPPTMEREEEQP
jgi:16S rRNA (guanine(966)-N(2))-methyltransferase RsmD